MKAPYSSQLRNGRIVGYSGLVDYSCHNVPECYDFVGKNLGHNVSRQTLTEWLAVYYANRTIFLEERVKQLEQIAPKKIKGPDGQTYVWRCPDELIPESS